MPGISIADGATPSQVMGVDATSRAGRATLYDAAGNILLPTRGANSPTAPAFLPVGGLVERSWRGLRMDLVGNARVGFDQLHMHDDVEGATINTQVWTQSNTTFAQAQAATTGIQFNSASGLAANSSSILTTQRQFFKSPAAPLRVRYRARVVPQTNAVAELGFGAPTTNTAQIANGACWRYTSGGTVVPVLYWNSSDVQQGTDISGLLLSANYYTWEIILENHAATFFCINANTGQIISEQILYIPITQPRLLAVTHIPAFVRLYITASAAPSAPFIFLSDAIVTAFDLATNKPWQHTMASIGHEGPNNPTTFASTATWTNSAEPTSATLSNTAAGYATLGGKFQFAAVAGAVTDYLLFGFTVPAPYSLYVTGVHISVWNTVVAVAVTPTLLTWALAGNLASVNLSTGAGRMVPCGAQSLPIGLVAGGNVADIEMPLEVPLRTEPGRVLGLVLRMPVGTATATQVIAGSAAIRGYFE